MSNGVGKAKTFLFGCIIWDKNVFCASVDTHFYYIVASKEATIEIYDYCFVNTGYEVVQKQKGL